MIDLSAADLKALEDLGANLKADYEVFDTISSGSLVLDRVLRGGYVRGQITSFTGDKGTGKTTICTLAALQTKFNGGLVAFIDTEHKMNVEYAWKSGLGVPGKDYILSYPADQESALETVRKLCNAGVDLVILDSLAGMSPRVARNKPVGEATVGLHARINSEWFRAAVPDIHRSKTAFIFTNQFREKIGITYGDPRTRPGGKAKDYHTAVAIDMLAPEFTYKEADAPKATAKSKSKVGGESEPAEDKKPKVPPIGIVINGLVKTSNVGPPNERFGVKVRWTERGFAINRASELVSFGKEYGILTKKDGSTIGGGNPYYYFGDEELGQGQTAAEITIRKNDDLRAALDEAVRAAIREGKAVIIQNGSEGSDQE